MEILSLEAQALNAMRSSSLADLRAKLFSKEFELDRSPEINEDKYSSKVLVGNWYEQRQSHADLPNDWKTIYQTDFKIHVSNAWKENEITRWDNQLNIEKGLPRDMLFENSGDEYFKNMATGYDLKYNILPKKWDHRKRRIYNERKMGWLPEEDLTVSFGNLTQFGLHDMLKTKWEEESEERARVCRWQTTYKLNSSPPSITPNLDSEKFKIRRAEYNTPNLEHLKDHKPDIDPCYFPYVAPTAIVN